MSLSGRLEDLQLRDLLQILHLSRNSGLLQLNSGEKQAELLFSDGLVVSALKSEAEKYPSAQFPGPGKSVAWRRQALISLVKELMYWDEGDFSFNASRIAESIQQSGSKEHDCLDQGLSLEEVLRDKPMELPVSEIKPKEPFPEHLNKTAAIPPPVGSAEQKPEVLLVDDDPEIAANLVRALARNGLSARSFSCGKDLLDAASSAREEEKSPLLIIDLIMPRLHGGGILGGLELVEQIRSSHADPLFLVYSDYPCPEVEQRLQQLEVTELFSKPVPQIVECEENSFVVNDFYDAIAKQSAALLGVSPPVSVKQPSAEAPSAKSSVVPSGKREMKAGASGAGIGVLKGMLQELQAVECGEQVMLLVLRFASEVLGRAVLFSVGKEHIVGLGQFGYGNAEVSADEKVRQIRLPLTEKSSLTEILKRPEARCGVLGEGHWDTYLRQELGLGSSSEVFIGPVISDGRVLAILCGDNQNVQQKNDENYALEIFLQQAGIILENIKLREQLHGFAGLLGKTFER